MKNDASITVIVDFLSVLPEPPRETRGHPGLDPGDVARDLWLSSLFKSFPALDKISGNP